MSTTRKYTIQEEVANAITHGVGILLATAALSILVVLAAIYGDAWRVISFSIYGVTLIILFLSSTLYHSFQNERVKYIFKIFDHISIYLLIAGTYTPFTLVSLRGIIGWTMFGVIWGIAIVGIVFKIFFIKRFKYISLASYILMGWVIVLAMKPLIYSLSFGGVMWLAGGGILYTLGTIFYAWKKLPYGHSIWHLFVLGGSVLHFFTMLFYVLPLRS